jgi:hypothetical protein
MPDKVDELYAKTLSFEKGLQTELNESYNHNRFKVLQKHIRFQVLNILVQRYSDHGADLKKFILYHHHDNDELGQRDITALLRKILKGLSDEEKIKLIKEAVQEISEMLMRIAIVQNRGRVAKTLQEDQTPLNREEKQAILERALGDDYEKYFLKRLKTFDQKTLANFTKAVELPMRGENEKAQGKACKKKLARHRRKLNEDRWGKPGEKEKQSKAMTDIWEARRQNGT